jgi:hypothetical protein
VSALNLGIARTRDPTTRLVVTGWVSTETERRILEAKR